VKKKKKRKNEMLARGEKKLKKSIKLRKLEKNNLKNRTVKKLIKILKKLTGSVRFGFGFISPKLKKPSQTSLNQSLSQKTESKPISLNQFRFGFSFF